MEQLTIQSLGFLKGFQEDIKVMIIIIIIIAIVIVIIIVILACPDARCESGQTSGSCRIITGYCTIWYLLHTHIYMTYMTYMTYESSCNMILILHIFAVGEHLAPEPFLSPKKVDEFYRNQFETKTSCGVAALGSWGYSPNSHFI